MPEVFTNAIGRLQAEILKSSLIFPLKKKKKKLQKVYGIEDSFVSDYMLSEPLFLLFTDTRVKISLSISII